MKAAKRILFPEAEGLRALSHDSLDLATVELILSKLQQVLLVLSNEIDKVSCTH